jgi:hypothetical protein
LPARAEPADGAAAGFLVPAGAESVTVALLAAGNDVARRCEGLITGTRT